MLNLQICCFVLQCVLKLENCPFFCLEGGGSITAQCLFSGYGPNDSLSNASALLFQQWRGECHPPPFPFVRPVGDVEPTLIVWCRLFVTWVFPKIGIPPKSSILIGFSLINHPFWGTTIFGNTHLSSQITNPLSPYQMLKNRKGLKRVNKYFHHIPGEQWSVARSTYAPIPSKFFGRFFEIPIIWAMSSFFRRTNGSNVP